MSGPRKQLISWLVFGGVIAGGWILMKVTVPTKADMLKVNNS